MGGRPGQRRRDHPWPRRTDGLLERPCQYEPLWPRLRDPRRDPTRNRSAPGTHAAPRDPRQQREL